MGLFGRKKVSVTVHGNESFSAGSDGRYTKQARKNLKAEKAKIKNLPLEPRSTAELCGYIEDKYGVKELPKDDEIVQEVAGKLSDWENLSLHCYNIVVMQGAAPAAFLEVFIEDHHDYLAFRTIDLECDDEYSVRRVKSDIVRYFGAGKEDKKENNERYTQYISVD